MANKATKRALLSSVLALFLCFSMLLGTTYAWFTDSVTSANNIIQSGTLDVEMEWAEGKEIPSSANWKDASTGAIFNYDRWEPGYVEAKHLKITNAGTLALKYQLRILANGVVSTYTYNKANRITKIENKKGAKKSCALRPFFVLACRARIWYNV